MSRKSVALYSGGAVMQLTFSCPSCGKEYDVPWSMSGKRARCKQCSTEFVIPAPFEAKPPRSSEAIPVTKTSGPPPTSTVARTVKMEVPPAALALAQDPTEPRRPKEPPRNEVLAQLRSGSAAINSEAPSPRVAPAEGEPSRAGRTPVTRKTSPKAPGRPAWLIPSIAGGGFSLLVALNIGLYLAFFGGKNSERIDENRSGLFELAEPATPALPPTPAVVASLPAVDRLPSPPKPSAKLPEPSPDRAMNTSEIVSRYEPSVALIKGKKGSGTGFVARPGIVVTNFHVIDGERIKDIEVRFPSAEASRQGPYPARRLYEDKGRDLVLLGVATDLPPVRVAEEYKFRKGEDVTVIGNPGVGGRMILENAISRGIVSSMTTINDHSFLQLGISINPGNSGGPVFDPKGRVIGVVTLKTTRQEGLAFAIPAIDLVAALALVESSASQEPAESPNRGPSRGR